jgi:histidyl-tRNA synthetase
MKIEIDNVKGFQDILPPESLKRAEVKRIIEKWFRLYGFVPMETPFIEFDELMRGDNIQEDEAVSDRFRLKDRAGRNLGLRYEFTFQLARVFRQNPNIKLPFKRYQIGEVFRDEPIGVGRFRQFTQCDVDIIGDNGIDSDAECLSVVSDILKELKIDSEIRINNRKLLSSIIESVQISDKNNVMRELDKLDKIGEDMVKLNLKKYADSNQVVTLFKLMAKPLDFFIENAFEGAKELNELVMRCNRYGVKAKFDVFMIRGLGYYTGNIFEVKALGDKNTIAAGGRYDKSVGKFVGREIPAVGISFGLERISALANIKVNSIPKVIVISLDKDREAAKLLKILRKEEISCMMMSGKVGKALEFANSSSIEYVIFLGDEEVQKKKFKLKNMVSGDERLLGEKSLIRALK